VKNLSYAASMVAKRDLDSEASAVSIKEKRIVRTFVANAKETFVMRIVMTVQ
jgi:hypothetical protein